MARALAHVPDWTELARTVARADQEQMMTTDTKTLWLPGTSMLCASGLVLIGMTQLVSSSMWAYLLSRGPLFVQLPWLLSYVVFGAIGAYWSRQAGGGMKARLTAGMFPLALNVVVTTIAFIGALVTDARGPASAGSGAEWGIVLAFVVVPGAALALGTLPFLRDRDGRRTTMTDPGPARHA